MQGPKKLDDTIRTLRQEYQKNSLDLGSVLPNPIDQFRKWLEEAVECGVEEAHAMSLGTCGQDGRPSVRIVLLRGIKESGFTFFTNYSSKKGIEIESNPFGALTFFWQGMERQVRIEGKIDKVSEAESDGYFLSRPEGNRLGAWASEQSKPIANRKKLEEKFTEWEENFHGKKIDRPPHWGGYILEPDSIEFWQGRPSRLHDRILFSLEKDIWKTQRLCP